MSQQKSERVQERDGQKIVGKWKEEITDREIEKVFRCNLILKVGGQTCSYMSFLYVSL